jgi:type VI secretion system secreted protein VgrG
VYNGKGQGDAQHNQIGIGAGAATGNAPAWFPGEAGAHAHAAVLSGLKSQAMGASQGGAGAYSQLLFDDTPGEPRVALQRHAAAYAGTDELNIGHLRHQADNERLAPAGFGAELKSEHGTALRAGQGMLLSTDARNGGSGHQLDTREAQSQIWQSTQLQQSLAETAQKHNAKIKDGKGGDEAAAYKLPAIAELAAAQAVVAGTQAGAAADAGGGGSAAAYDAPQLQLSAPAGIAVTTPASAVMRAGASSSISAAQDINFMAQGCSLHAVKDGISLFTYGKTGSANKPNQETGIKLHAASGKVSVQSQSGPTTVTADKAITVVSVGKSVTVAARQHLMLAAQGAYLKLEGGNIMLHGPGTTSFKASMKELTGPLRGNPVGVDLHAPGDIRITPQVRKLSTRVVIDRQLQDAIAASFDAGIPYRFLDHEGQMIAKGMLDDQGRTQRVFHDSPAELTVLLGKKADWTVVRHEHEDGCGCGGHDDVATEPAGQHDETAPAEAAVQAGPISVPSDDVVQSKLLDHLVFSTPEVLQAILDGED